MFGSAAAFCIQVTIMLHHSFSLLCTHAHTCPGTCIPAHTHTHTHTQAAESEMCPSFSAAMKAGKPVYTDAQPSLADGLAVPKVSQHDVNA